MVLINKNFVITSLCNTHFVKITGSVIPSYGQNRFQLLVTLSSLTTKEQKRTLAILQEPVFMLSNNTKDDTKNNIWFGVLTKKEILYTDKNLAVIDAYVTYMSTLEACEVLHKQTRNSTIKDLH